MTRIRLITPPRPLRAPDRVLEKVDGGNGGTWNPQGSHAHNRDKVFFGMRAGLELAPDQQHPKRLLYYNYVIEEPHGKSAGPSSFCPLAGLPPSPGRDCPGLPSQHHLTKAEALERLSAQGLPQPGPQRNRKPCLQNSPQARF